MGNIISFDDLQTEGIDDPPYDHNRVDDLILAAEEAVEAITGRIFHRIEITSILASGRGNAILILRHAPISVTKVEYLSPGFAAVEIDPTVYEIITDLRPENNWLHPRLKRLDGDLWLSGEDNYKITGSFGCVTPDGGTPPAYSAPRMIKRAVMLIVVKMIPELKEKIGGSNQDRIISETLGNYSYTLTSQAMQTGFFGDSEIDSILSAYKRIGMAAV